MHVKMSYGEKAQAVCEGSRLRSWHLQVNFRCGTIALEQLYKLRYKERIFNSTEKIRK